MIFKTSNIYIADNTGPKKAKCLNIKKNLYEFSINQIEEYVKKGIKNNVTWIK